MTMTTPARPTSTPNVEQQQEQPTQFQPFPPPQTFTFLPQLYTLISHLAPLQPQSSNAQSSSATGSRASRSPTLTRRPAPSVTSAPPDSAGDNTSAMVNSTGSTAATGGPLSLTQTRSRDEIVEIKDLPALVYPLRQQIERAKEVVRGLPDVERSVEDQEREIRELEGKIGGLRGRLRELGQIAGKARGTDVVMSGVEV